MADNFKFSNEEMAFCVYGSIHEHKESEDDDRDDELIASLYALFEVEPL